MKIPSLEEVMPHYPEFVGIHPACSAVPMIDEEGFANLVDSIRKYGLKEPLIKTTDDLLLDGRTRLLACYEAHQDIRVRVYDGALEPWHYVKLCNIDRRHLTVGQIAMYGQAWLDDERKKAKERQAHGGTAPGVTLKEHGPEALKGQSRDKVAERLGISGKSVEQARKVSASSPDLAAKVSSGEVSLRSAYNQVKHKEEQDKSLPVDKPAKKGTGKTTTIITDEGVVSEIALPAKVVFNATNDSVDWAQWTWNPVTGCRHGCGFCYAREIANSSRMADYYPNKFTPTFHEYRLAAPKNTKVPDSDDPRSGRVFVCSMADLFGKWVPDEWIEKVFDACLESPEWEYLFLTKWPARYSQMPLLKAAWYGASIIQQSDVSRVESAMKKFEAGDCVKWISLEPMLQPIKFNDLSWCDLVVIGAQTSTNQPDGHVPAFSPKYDWVHDVVEQCRKANVPYYLKENLLSSPGMELPKSGPRAL